MSRSDLCDYVYVLFHLPLPLSLLPGPFLIGLISYARSRSACFQKCKGFKRSIPCDSVHVSSGCSSGMVCPLFVAMCPLGFECNVFASEIAVRIIDGIVQQSRMTAQAQPSREAHKWQKRQSSSSLNRDQHARPTDRLNWSLADVR